jgi:hypothetical protein
MDRGTAMDERVSLRSHLDRSAQGAPNQPAGAAFLLLMIPERWMLSANSLVSHGATLDLAMTLIFPPLILQLMERERCTA